jgi:coproporphyrinogen III oxidase-like Fe-S oxidoreductase
MFFGNNQSDVKMGLRSYFAHFAMKQACKLYLKPKKFNSDFPINTDNKKRLLYVHIPFCFSLCTYCTFHKFIFQPDIAKTYFKLLKRELQLFYDKGYNFGAMYIGGGTPTVLPEELGSFVSYAKSIFDIKEVSCESDPNHVNLPILENTVGKIDRLSIGIQTFNDNYLKRIGRYEKFGSGEEQFENVKKILPHFPLINIDMIYNYPEQKNEELVDDIKKVLELNPQQITFYPLMFSSNGESGIKNIRGFETQKREAELFSLIAKKMKDSSYFKRTQWAYSNKNNNIIDEYVVDNEEYVGAGSGAFGFINDTLYINSFSLKEYGTLVNNNKTSATKKIKFNKRAIKQYRMIVDMFGYNFKNINCHPQPELNLFKIANFIKKNSGEYLLTPQGEFVMSLLMAEFYNGTNKVRTAMRKDLTEEDSLFYF